MNRSSEISHDPYGRSIAMGPTFKFTLRIKNLGNAPLAQPFYISFSTTQEDFEKRYCDHTSIVNQQAETITPDSSLDVEVVAFIEPPTSSVFFVINTNNLCGRGAELPVIEESNYNNNWFDMRIDKAN
ncbi:MAG TPA: hypothetical protein VLX91_02215 [Candidatus Acidoferrales bacterium]|nr:hypothetical protein [Candidatus Acidoferrales bacterium]